MFKSLSSYKEESLLLNKINSRDKTAFCEIYDLLYNDLHAYSLSLYRNFPIDSADTIHDIFLYVWQNDQIIFDSLHKFKAYLIVAIKNGFKSYINHTKYQGMYHDYIENNKFNYDLLEVEIFSFVDEALNILPSDCAYILKMSLEGWSADEISEKMGKKPQTIYNKKQKAISILKEKYPNKILIITILFATNI